MCIRDRDKSVVAPEEGDPGDKGTSLKEAAESGWVIRPAEPLDQASIFNMSFTAPFKDVSEKEIFVAHPVGTRVLAGAVMMQWAMSS